MTGQVQHHCQIKLKELFRHGPRPRIVQSPLGAVGKYAPAEMSRGQVVHPPQVAQHLSRGRGLLARTPRPAVERPLPTLGLHHGQAEFIALPFLGEGVGTVLGLCVGEQQAVGHVLPALSSEVLLSQARCPPEVSKNRPDQIILSLALVGCLGDREAIEERP